MAFTFASVWRTKEEASKDDLFVESKIGNDPVPEQQFKKGNDDCIAWLDFCGTNWNCISMMCYRYVEVLPRRIINRNWNL